MGGSISIRIINSKKQIRTNFDLRNSSDLLCGGTYGNMVRHSCLVPHLRVLLCKTSANAALISYGYVRESDFRFAPSAESAAPLVSELPSACGRLSNPYSRMKFLGNVTRTGIWFVTRSSFLTSEFCFAKRRRTKSNSRRCARSGSDSRTGHQT